MVSLLEFTEFKHAAQARRARGSWCRFGGSTTLPERSDGALCRCPLQHYSPLSPHIRPARLEPGAGVGPGPAGAA